MRSFSAYSSWRRAAAHAKDESCHHSDSRLLEEVLAVFGIVKVSDIFPIAVVDPRRNLATGIQEDLGRLTPARVIKGRAYVGVEPILAGNIHPERPRTAPYKLDLDDRLDTLESIFPGQYQTRRRSILLVQRVAINSERKKRQLIQSLFHGQRLIVGPRITSVLLSRQLLGTQHSHQPHISGAILRTELLDDL